MGPEGEDGPPSDQEVALLRELLAAAKAMTAVAAREHRAAANWQPQRQPWAGVAGANDPDPLSGLWWAAFRLDTAKAAGDQAAGDHQAATIEAGKALQEAAIVVCERGPHRRRPGRQGG